jgi:hypothetical protein
MGSLHKSKPEDPDASTERSKPMKTNSEQTQAPAAPKKDAQKSDESQRKHGPVFSDWAMI